MKEVTIQTDSMTRFDSAVDDATSAGKAHSGFVLAYGQAGRGKSVAADRYYIQHGGVYVRVWQNWSQSSFLQRVLFETRGQNTDMPRHNGNRCKELIVAELGKALRPLFIDEADRLHMDRLEDLRDIFEMTGAPVILIGEENLTEKLSGRRRIWSRVVHEVAFTALSPREVALYAMQGAALEIGPDMCKIITETACGDFRLVRNMLLLLEKSAKAAQTRVVDKAMLQLCLSAKTWKRG